MNKKIVSLMVAGAMVAGMPLSVSAGPVTTPTGNADVETEGTVGYLNTDVFSVELPTAGCFNFTVDPQGILSAIDSTNYPEELYPGGTAGRIIATEGSGAYINNKSSVPIKLMVEAYVEKDASTGDPSSVNLLSTDQYGLINSGIDNNMWLTLDITSDEFAAQVMDPDNPVPFTDGTAIKTGTVNPNVLAITQNGAPTAPVKGTQVSFALNKAAYEFTGTNMSDATYTMKSGELGDSVGMRLSGMVNTNADWSAYAGSSAEKIIVKTVFDFAKLSTDYEQSALDGRAHGVLSDADPTYSEAGVDENGDPVAHTMDYTVGQGGIEIPFSFGTGTKEVSVTDITVGGSLDPKDYKVHNNVISLKTTEANVKAAIDAAKAAAEAAPGTGVNTPATVVITTSDGKTTTVTINMYYI